MPTSSSGPEEASRARDSRASGAADFAIIIGNVRIRANIYRSNDGLSAAFRIISDAALTPEEIDLDRKVTQMILSQGQGLVLGYRPHGVGKSTTVTALVEKLNQQRKGNIITIEDPVEFVYKPQLCTIQQREVAATFVW